MDARRAELLTEELAVLGCALNSERRSLVAMVESYVPEPEAFCEPVSRALWLGMREIARSDAGPLAINPATVEAALAKLQALSLLEGEGLPGRTPHQLVLDAYVAAVESRPALDPDALQGACAVLAGRLSLTRLYQLCAGYAARARQPGQEPTGLIAELSSELGHLMAQATPLDQKMVTLDQAILTKLAEIAAIQAGQSPVLGLSTGYPDVDKQFGGLRPGRLVILGGAFKDGKSVIAQTVAQTVALNDDRPVLYFSYEMDDREIAERHFSQQLGVHPNAVRWGTVLEIEGVRVADFAASLREPAPGSPQADLLRRWRNFIYVDATPMTVAEIEGAVRHTNHRLEQEGRPAVGLVVVDYIQLMTGRRGSVYGSRQDLVYADISRDLKQMARQLKVAVFALSQLSAAGDGTGAAGSRMLEANADNYWTIHQKLPGEDFGMLYLKRNRNARNRLAFKMVFDFDRLIYRMVDTIHDDPEALLRPRPGAVAGGEGEGRRADWQSVSRPKPGAGTTEEPYDPFRLTPDPAEP